LFSDMELAAEIPSPGTNERIIADMKSRDKTIVSPVEYAIGKHRGEIQAQLRDALPNLFIKGYDLVEWGFRGQDKEIQFIDGIFRIKDAEVKKKLAEMDVKVHEYEFGVWKNTEIFFLPPRPVISEVKQTWDAIAAILPHTGDDMKNRWNTMADVFRKYHIKGDSQQNESGSTE
jgi:hypothetical protein